MSRRFRRGPSEPRLRAIMIVMAMLISVFGARLLQLQGLDPQAYAARADAEGLVTAVLPADRGSILDRHGAQLARTVAGVMVVADPFTTKPHAGEIARILADGLGVDYFDTVSRLRRASTEQGKDIRFAYIQRRVPATKARKVLDRLKKAELPGIYTRPDPVRDYPAHDVAANLVGFLGEPGIADSGGGLERSFDGLLAGQDGHETYEAGAGNRIPLGEKTQVDPVDGEDLRLTIDRDVQWYAQRVLREAVERVNGASGVAIAMDTRTGEILALADHPTFDANHPGRAAEEDRGSRALSNVYEPGSVQKVLTAGALVDAGLARPRTRITVPESVTISGWPIRDHYDHGRIRLTLAGVIAKSSNLGTLIAARQMPPEQYREYLSRFGLGERAEIGLSGQTRGILPPLSSWTGLTHATVSYGQGVSVNALQMTAAVNTIANGGEYVSPSLVRGRATTAVGVEVGTDTATRSRVITKRAAKATAQMMEMVTTPGVGTAGLVGVEGYRVAGKTGTSDQVGESGRYDHFAVSFGGFAPADDPRFTVYVMIKDPQGRPSGGGMAGPAFSKIMAHLLQHYSVPPTGTAPPNLPVEW